MKKIYLLIAIIFAGVHTYAQNVGVDQANPVNKLDVNGGLSVGSNYSGTFTAPANGAIFEGQVGIGTAMPMADLDINGTVRVGSLTSGGTSMVVADANGNLSVQALTADAQNLSLSGFMLNITNGTGVDLSAFLDNTDAQTLSLSGSNLSISGGNSIALPFALPYSAGTGISISGSTITNTAPDQTVSITGSGATSVSGTYPNFTVNSTDNVDDADASPTNEIQTLSLSGTNLSISSGNNVDLNPIIPASPWTESGGNVYRTTGRVGVGMTNPLGRVAIRTDSSAITGSDVNVSGLSLMLDKNSNSTTDNAVGIGFGSSTNFGAGQPSAGAAIIHQRTGSSSVGKLHFATKSSGGGTSNIPIRMTLDAAGDLGIGTMDPLAKLHIENGSDASISGGGYLITGATSGLNIGIDDNEIMARNNGATAQLYLQNDGGDLIIGQTGSGNVGIGVNPPTAKLHVNGDIRLANDRDILGTDLIEGFNDLRFSGNPGTTDFSIAASGNAGFGTVYSNVTLAITNIAGNSTIFSVDRSNNSPVFEVQDDQDVIVTGDFFVNSGSKNFILDHPLDPANKSLAHNAIEGPGYITYYNGSIVLDANGNATVTLPDYFEALNTDFHYQLTCVGGFAQVYVAEEIADNQFKIAGGNAGLKVSWQVTADRNDPWAQDNPYQAELEKEGEDKGRYWYPAGYGKPESMRVGNNDANIVPEND